MIAEVVFFLSFRKTYSYRIGDTLQKELAVGCRVLVPFGRQKKIGIVWAIHPAEESTPHPLKDIINCLDSSPLFDKQSMACSEKIANYYMQPLGLVLKNAVPKILREEKKIVHHPTVIKAKRTITQAAQDAVIGDPDLENAWKTHTILLCDNLHIADANYERFLQVMNGKQVFFLAPTTAHAQKIYQNMQAKGYRAQWGGHRNPHKAYETWQDIIRGKKVFVVGTKSMVFMPFCQADYVVVMEEHSPYYKEHFTSFRYHARDIVLLKAASYSLRVLLCAATPSMESYHNTQLGKYGTIRMDQRGKKIPIVPINTTEEQKKRKMRGILSLCLLDQIEKVLATQEKVLLLHDKKGYYTHWQCRNCKKNCCCAHCGLSLPYVAGDEGLCPRCKKKTSLGCASCISAKVEGAGYGVDRIGEFLTTLFPFASAVSIDGHGANNKKTVTGRLESIKNADIVVGTRWLIEHMPRQKIGLFGVLSLESLLNFPDFRAHERAYQLLQGAVDRLTEKNQGTQFFIQSMSKTSPWLNAFVVQDYTRFAKEELAERIFFNYPPHSHMMSVVLSHTNSMRLDKAYKTYKEKIVPFLKREGGQCIDEGNSTDAIKKGYKSRYFVVTMRKNGAHTERIKHHMQAEAEQVIKQRSFGSVSIIFDVDTHQLDT